MPKPVTAHSRKHRPGEGELSSPAASSSPIASRSQPGVRRREGVSAWVFGVAALGAALAIALLVSEAAENRVDPEELSKALESSGRKSAAESLRKRCRAAASQCDCLNAALEASLESGLHGPSSKLVEKAPAHCRKSARTQELTARLR